MICCHLCVGFMYHKIISVNWGTWIMTCWQCTFLLLMWHWYEFIIGVDAKKRVCMYRVEVVVGSCL